MCLWKFGCVVRGTLVNEGKLQRPIGLGVDRGLVSGPFRRIDISISENKSIAIDLCGYTFELTGTIAEPHDYIVGVEQVGIDQIGRAIIVYVLSDQRAELSRNRVEAQNQQVAGAAERYLDAFTQAGGVQPGFINQTIGVEVGNRDCLTETERRSILRRPNGPVLRKCAAWMYHKKQQPQDRSGCEGANVHLAETIAEQLMRSKAGTTNMLSRVAIPFLPLYRAAIDEIASLSTVIG